VEKGGIDGEKERRWKNEGMTEEKEKITA